MVGPYRENNMLSGRLGLALAAGVLAAVQVATPAKAETWSFFPWYAPTQAEKPRVTHRIEQPAPAPVVAPAQAVAPAPVRTTRVVAPAPVESQRSIFSRPYIVVGLGI
jgi:hypothetical protein